MDRATNNLDNPNILAGFTFFGQFIDHDITFDPTSSFEQQNEPEAIENFRTPALELDSIYGRGPIADPHLYDISTVSNKKLWLLSLISALLITLFSGTIGALFGEYVVRGGSLRTYSEGGYTGVNVEGVLVWGTIYAFILLPLTTPMARLIIQLFFELLKKM